MSNARSPREVCSTTMGTRGLIGDASLTIRTLVPGSPQAALGTSLLLLGGPQLLAPVTARELRLGEVLGCSYHLVRRDAFRHRLFLPTPDATPQRRAQLRAAAMVEFEVKRDPDRSNIEIARAIRSSARAVMNAPAAGARRAR